MIKSLKISAIVVLIIVDLLAINLAVRHAHQRPKASSTASVARTSTPAATATKKTPSPDASRAGLSVAGSSIGLLTAGSCDAKDSAKLELSSDRGATFEEVALPLEKATAGGKQATAVTRILSLDLASAKAIALIGDTTDCKPARWTSSDAGQTWKQDSSIAGWYVDGSKVFTASGEIDASCEPVSVSGVSDRNAKVTCKDSRILGTDDVGKSWVALGSLEGVTSVSFVSVAEGYAVAKTVSCAAQSYLTASAGGAWQATGCIDDKTPATAIDGTTKLLAALVGSEVFVSVDNGATWKATQ